MSARTAARRRRQMVNGMTHLAHLGRPVYPKPQSAAKKARQAMREAARKKRMQAKKS